MNAKQAQQLNDTLSKCRDLLRLQHKALATEDSYIPQIRSYMHPQPARAYAHGSIIGIMLSCAL